MQRSESRQLLLTSDYLQCFEGTNDDHIDKSIIEHFSGCSKQEKRQVMVFKQNTKAFFQPFSIPVELYDVVFIVGKDKIPVYGVRSLLTCRSRIFYNMFLEAEKHTKTKSKKAKADTKLRVTVPDYQVNVMKKLIEYLQTGTIVLNTRHIVGLYCAAVEFELQQLRQICCKFLQSVNTHQIPTIKNWIYFYGNKKAVKIILQTFVDRDQFKV